MYLLFCHCQSVKKKLYKYKNGKEIIKRGLFKGLRYKVSSVLLGSDVLMQNSDVLQCWVLLWCTPHSCGSLHCWSDSRQSLRRNQRMDTNIYYITLLFSEICQIHAEWGPMIWKHSFFVFTSSVRYKVQKIAGNTGELFSTGSKKSYKTFHSKNT